MTNLLKREQSSLGYWWWTIDRWILGATLVIIFLGILLSFAASPSVAERLHLDTFFFVKRHITMAFIGVLLLIFFSFMSPIQIRRFSFVFSIVGCVLLIVTLAYGLEIKGAKRWLYIKGFSLQISEFVKSTFIIFTAWMLAEKHRDSLFPGALFSFFLLSTFVFLLLLQPDLGMAFIVVSTWVGQLFIAGISFVWIVFFIVIGFLSAFGAYIFFPHVNQRINIFFKPKEADPLDDLYQITQSLDAFSQGGLLGKGPGEGIIKYSVPDAHADFIFAVAGEEFGFLFCFFIICLFLFVVVRSLLKITNFQSIFIVISSMGLIIMFAQQALINMASALYLIPTKGMTMPFVSYGGSSLLSMSMSIGMLLSFTRKRHGIIDVL
ncbi:MAG: FtsW/RodA/SpoVE family cell cycle protein [Alphaproteobacteria bacterium]